MKTNPKMKYGKMNLLPGKIEPKDEMIMISVKMEGDLLDALKNHAKELGRPYQTVMKEMLRTSLGMENKSDAPPRDWAEIFRQLQDLKSRMEHVEEGRGDRKARKKA